jgi:3',5'-cyclic AMP phosphodiesterase CpdA
MAYVLAHLSDPHLAPLPNPHWSELVGKRATGYFNWRRKRHLVHDAGTLERIVVDLKARKPDHIAVTGDIANIATAAEFRAGRAWLDTLGSANDVSFVPGNHDIYVRRASAYAAELWGDHMRGDDGKNEFPYLRRRGPLALIGLSSAVPTAPLMATGLVGARQLDRFATLLGSLKNDGVFRVVLIHHPPMSEAKRHRRLRDAAALRRVIAAQGADLVLHGHDHLAMLNWLEGPGGTRVPAIGVPSASAAPGTSKHAAGYNLYCVDGAPGAWRCEMIARGVDAAGAVGEQTRMMLT